MSDLQRKKSFVIVRAINIIIAFVILILTVASILYTLLFAEKIGEVRFLKMAITDLGMMFSGILIACCYINTKNYTRIGSVFSAIPVLLFFNIFLSGIIDVVSFNSETRKIIFIIQTSINIISIFIHILFWLYQCASLPKNRGKRYFTVWIFTIIIVYFIILVTNPFTKILFFVDESCKLIYSGETIELILFSLLYLSYLVYILPQRCTWRKKLSVASFAFFPMLFVAITLIWYNFGEVYTVSSFYFMFMLLAAYVVFFGDYLESKELLLRQKAELAEKEHRQTELQTALMLSQIRPHFLYNAITAIRYLCKNDPAKAYTSLGLFSDYLRGNMDALSNGRSIPFEKELEHIKTYLTLEQIRFGDELKVEYDIRYSDFSIPALTVQPIVENAVRHGATMNENGGKIIISSFKTENGALITVTDNGPGFDVNAPFSDDRNHFGLQNVRSCLEAMKCGELKIDSKKGTGTTVKIFILEEKQ
ncbi:MAG: histidine kinase [Clostridia bacterium]|nr:histidine kinase [Clostridia bacterium]